MPGIESDSIFCGSLCPLETNLQKGVEGVRELLRPQDWHHSLL